MKENYLQNKVREQQDQINNLVNLNEDLQTQIKQLPTKKDLDDFYENHRKEQARVVVENTSLINPIFNKLYTEHFQKDIKILQSNIQTESNKTNNFLSKQLTKFEKGAKEIDDHFVYLLNSLISKLVLQGIIKEKLVNVWNKKTELLNKQREMK